MICLQGQTYVYTGKAIGINAGNMTVSRKMVNGAEVITNETQSKINYLLGEISIDHFARATYKNGKLQEAYMRQEKNGKLETYCSVSYDGKCYHVTNDQGKSTCYDVITLSLTKIFFEEPDGDTQIFSESLGKHIPIKKIGEHTYEATLPDGGKYTYYYENGKMVKMDVPSPVGRAHFYLQN